MGPKANSHLPSRRTALATAGSAAAVALMAPAASAAEKEPVYSFFTKFDDDKLDVTVEFHHGIVTLLGFYYGTDGGVNVTVTEVATGEVVAKRKMGKGYEGRGGVGAREPTVFKMDWTGKNPATHGKYRIVAEGGPDAFVFANYAVK